MFTACKQAMPHVPDGALDWVAIDPEALKRIYDDLALESGVSLLFNSQVCGVETDGKGSVSSVIVSNKSGLSAFRAGVYGDCSGDGDLAAWAGAEFEKGGPGGSLQPATHCFILSNAEELRKRLRARGAYLP